MRILSSKVIFILFYSVFFIFVIPNIASTFSFPGRNGLLESYFGPIGISY